MGYLVVGAEVAGPSGVYAVERALPESGFGRAFVGRDTSGCKVLLKEVHLADPDAWKRVAALEREAHVTSHLVFARIPRFMELFAFDGERAKSASELSRSGPTSSTETAERPPSLILVRRYIEGTTVAEAIEANRRFTALELETILRGLLETRQYLDTLLPSVIHGDCSPSNVVIDERGEPWLIDFGAVCDEVKGSPSAAVGTSGFMAPEQLAGRATEASDLYAMAMTVLCAATHRAAHDMPIDARAHSVAVRDVAPRLSERARRTIEACLEPTVEKRPRSAREALALLDGDSIAMLRASEVVRNRIANLRTPAKMGLALLGLMVPLLVALLPFWAHAHYREPAFAAIHVPVALLVSSPTPPVEPTPAPVIAPPAPVVPAVSIEWTGVVEHATKGLAPGDSCLMTLTVTPGISTDCVLALTCKDRVVVHDAATSECTLSETYVGNDALVYRAALSSDTGTEAEDPELALDWATGELRVAEPGVGDARDEVVAKLDKRSLVRKGGPILDSQRFEKHLTLAGVAVRTTGAPKTKKGERCTFSLKPRDEDTLGDLDAPNCEAIVQCGTDTLYDGMGACELMSDGTPFGFVDTQGSAADGDATVTVSGHELRLGDMTTHGQVDVLIYLDELLQPEHEDGEE